MPAPAQQKHPQGHLAAGRRVYAIGDIHGRADLLQNLLEQIGADASTFQGSITLVGLGDYINRGANSAGVVDLLLTLPASWQKVFIKGNHEWGLEELLAGRHLDWLDPATLQSYDVQAFDNRHKPREGAALAAEFAHAIRSRGHENFYRSLKLWHRLDGYGFVHAGVRRGLALEDQLESDLMAMRPAEFKTHGLPERIVFGHTVFAEPLIEPDRLGLDTGAFKTGLLTAAVLEGTGARFLQTPVARP
jgi:serine/threonine protein phosphatase 1